MESIQEDGFAHIVGIPVELVVISRQRYYYMKEMTDYAENILEEKKEELPIEPTIPENEEDWDDDL